MTAYESKAPCVHTYMRYASLLQAPWPLRSALPRSLHLLDSGSVGSVNMFDLVGPLGFRIFGKPPVSSSSPKRRSKK
eukprot:5175135-Pyramimonas_sp.AAC.1